MQGLHRVFEELARSTPSAPAVCDGGGAWTYAELWAQSGRVAGVLAAVGPPAVLTPAPGVGPRPLALAVPRGREWYAVCLAAWRLGLPVVALSDDLPGGGAAESERAARVSRELEPAMLVTDGAADSTLPGRPGDCSVVGLSHLKASLGWGGGTAWCGAPAPPGAAVGPDGVMCYVYTGGTTKHSKCVVVTHAMALWEMRHYGTALRGCAGPGDRMLQYSSAFWGAAVFGQLDLALAFGACSVVVSAQTPEEIASACAAHSVSVLGVVPSQLRGAWPGGPGTKPPSLRTVVAWADRFPVELAREWATAVHVRELLIASEYWLALYSDCTACPSALDGVERHVFRPLPELDFLLEKEDGSPAGVGEVGEMLLAGPTVTPGYLGPGRCIFAGPDNESSFHQAPDGPRRLRTRDRLERVPGGGLLYHGRAGSLTKRGGAWVDLEAIEAAVAAVQGVSAAAVVAAGGRLDAYVALDPVPPWAFSRVLEQARRALGPECGLHVRSALPLHPATAKADRRRLAAEAEAAGSRGALRGRLLARAQRRMLAGYLAWHGLTLAAVLARCLSAAAWRPAAAGEGLLWAASLEALRRLLLLPFLWAAVLYGAARCGAGQRAQAWPLGPPDLVLLAALVLPRRLLGSALAAACAYASWARGARRPAASCLLAVLACDAAGRLLPGVLLLLPLVLLAAPAAQQPLRFLLGLPVSYFFAFPKWARDDWSWRATSCSSSILRRAVFAAVPALRKPKFSEHLAWDARAAAVDWGDDQYWMHVVMARSSQDTVCEIYFWDDIRPVVPRSTDCDCRPAQHAAAGNGVGRDAGALAMLAERVGAHPPSLASVDSLQAISLVELARRELGKALRVSDVLRCSDVHQLAECLRVLPQEDAEQGVRRGPRGERADSEGAYRVYMMAFPKSPVDWYVRYGGPGALDMAALQRAADRLVARHSALRTRESPDEAMREAMDRAAAVWQLFASCCGPRRGGPLWSAAARAVGASLLACWPRTLVRPAGAARVAVRLLEVLDEGCADGQVAWSAEELMFWKASEVRNNRSQRYPFELFAVRVPGRAGSRAHPAPSGDLWYLYAGITHAYSDGACGQALFRDLLHLYAEEAGVAEAAPPPPPSAEPLATLQGRLRRSLCGRLRGDAPDAGSDLYHEVACEDWGLRDGFQRRVRLEESVLRTLRAAALDVIGCSIDVAWLTAIMGAMFRLFPNEACFHLVLKCSCRDGPGEAEMVGFLSEQRVFPVDVGNTRSANLLDVAARIDAARRSRSWRAPVPYEASLCVYVNIVSSMLDALPLGCRHVVAEAPSPRAFMTDAYNHVNFRLDQRTEVDWDFRIFHYDAEWGWEWGSYFAWSLGAAIADMAECPTAPLVPPPRMPRGGQEPGRGAAAAAPRGAKRRGSPGPLDQGDAAAGAGSGRPAGGDGVEAHAPKAPRVRLRDGGSAQPLPEGAA